MFSLLVFWALIQLSAPLHRCYTIPNGTVVCTCGRTLTGYNPRERIRPPENAIAADLMKVEDFAEDLFEKAQRGEWPQSQQHADALVAAVCAFEDDSESKTSETNELDSRVIRAVIAAKQQSRTSTMDEANEITRVASALAANFQPTVPIRIEMLDYYGRKFDVGIQNKDLAALRRTASDLRRTWDGARHAVEARGGAKTATRFDRIVRGLEHADHVAAYVPLVRAEQRQAEDLEGLYNGKEGR
jgi:hypothetical protein